MSTYTKGAATALAARSMFAGVQPRGNDTMSVLGTPQAPTLPQCLTNNPMPDGQPWGSHTANNTNYYTTTPNTGVTRYYDWTISKVPCAPDGVQTTCLLVNDQYPGPTIEANWGDWIQVTVTNNIPDEGTAIHWHGILQKNTPYMDGVPGFDQCPIAPGKTFTYRFTADLYGTTWWHSHYESQYSSGLVGPLVVYGPLQNGVSYDEDLGPVMVSDWYHEYYQTVTDALLAPLPAVNIPRSDNNLVNGKNSFNCSSTTLSCTPNSPLASFNVTSGKTYRIRFINPSAAAVQKITVDGHTFTVFANDFVPIQPYETDVLTLAVGQRTDVLIKANMSSNSSVWMRGYKPEVCWPSNGGDEVKAAIFYENANRSQAPTSSPGPNAYNTYCGNDPLSETVPVYPIAVPNASVTEVIPLEFKSNGTNLLWYMSNRTFRVDFNDPILLDAKLGNLDFPYIRNVHDYGTNSSLRFIVENTGVQPHPMHVHGHNIFVLAEGACSGPVTGFTDVNGTAQGGSMPPYWRDSGSYSGAPPQRASGRSNSSCWDGQITRPSNPQRRDVQMLMPGSYVVLQWNQDNPGTWPFHCHIAWHLSSGFVWSVLENPESIQQNLLIPDSITQTCADWAAWTKSHVVDQIGDGL